MTVSTNDLIEIDGLLSASDAETTAWTELRRRLPHLSWTRCDASDVGDTPFREYERFDVHLVDSTNHCAQITSDPEQATGVVLAHRNPRP